MKSDSKTMQSSDIKTLHSCSICLEAINISEAAYPNSCSDMFHQICLQQWLLTGNGAANCPTCCTSFDDVVPMEEKVPLSLPAFSSISNLCQSADPILHSLHGEMQSPIQPTYTQVTPVNEGVLSATLKTFPSSSSEQKDYAYVNHQYGDVVTLQISDDSNSENSEPCAVLDDPVVTFQERLSALINSKVNKDNEDSCIRIKVRRNSVWSDAKFKLGRVKKMSNTFVKVVFIGESAVDDGGPKREFFNLVNKSALSSALFVGEELAGKAFTKNFAALSKMNIICMDFAVPLGS